ncbi:MAG: acetyl-CoA carboxylase biotin carboxyl carrier protein [Bacteroides sp.]
MELENILKLIDHVSKSELSSFSLEEDGTSIKMEVGRTEVSCAVPANIAVPAQENVVVMQNVQPANQNNTEVNDTDSNKIMSGNVVKSPLVGVFYAAPAPDADDFVTVGDTVSSGQTLGIIEAMKLMNEIESEFNGCVKQILVKNGDMVEYGQPLFVIE